MINQVNSVGHTPGSLENVSDGTRPAERKLSLSVDVVRTMSDSGISLEPPGWIRRPISWSCPQPTEYGSCRCPPLDD